MDTKRLPTRIAELRLEGKYAHFRKFYTNASSLTYLLPPRTAICGMLASILLISRDSYYDLLSSQNISIAVSITTGHALNRFFQTLNYVSENASCVNDLSQHKQCRFELLTGVDGGSVAYRIWIGVGDDVFLATLLEKIRYHDLGFGVYLGQRQFIADLSLIREYNGNEFNFLPQSTYIDSAIRQDLAEPEMIPGQRLMLEKMPLEQTLVTVKKQSYRQNVRIGDVIFETSGARIQGKFQECVQLHDQAETVIAFL